MENIEADKNSKSKAAQWTDGLNKIFIELAHEQTIKGNRPGSTFNRTGWTIIRNEFNKRTGRNYSHQQLKNHLNALRLKWRAWNKVIRVSGFGWDPFKKVVTADDQCWASYIKENPDAEKFRTTTCPSYNELTIIFGDTCGTGWAQIAPSQDVDALDEDLSISKEGLHDSASNTLGEEPSFGDGVQDNISETEGEDNHRKRRIDTLSGSRRGKRESRGSELSQVLESLVEVQKERNASRAQFSSATTSNPFSISNCIRELHQMEGVDQESDAVFKAMEKFQSPGWRETFLMMLPQQRLRWLKTL